MKARFLGALDAPVYNKVSAGVLFGTAWWSACIALLQFHGAALEYWRGETVLMWLDIASGALAVGAAASAVAPGLAIPARRALTTCFIIVAVMLEIETAFHDPDYPFYDARQYLIIIVTTLFLAVIFPGRPAVFLACAVTFTGIYLLRSIPEGIQHRLPLHGAIVFSVQLLFSSIVSAGIQYWIFRLRYTNIKQADELSAAHRKLGRQMMMRDIHDHLGSRLADISNLAERIKSDRSDTTIEALSGAAAKAALLLRQGLLAERDREMLEEDFGNALRVILFSRYEGAGRQIWIRYRADSQEILKALPDGTRNELHAIALEITTNDLKYGTGTAVLDLRPGGARLQLRFTSRTMKPSAGGIGSGSLVERTRRIGGTYHRRIRSGRIFIRIAFPLSGNGKPA